MTDWRIFTGTLLPSRVFQLEGKPLLQRIITQLIGPYWAGYRPNGTLQLLYLFDINFDCANLDHRQAFSWTMQTSSYAQFALYSREVTVGTLFYYNSDYINYDPTTVQGQVGVTGDVNVAGTVDVGNPVTSVDVNNFPTPITTVAVSNFPASFQVENKPSTTLAITGDFPEPPDVMKVDIHAQSLPLVHTDTSVSFPDIQKVDIAVQSLPSLSALVTQTGPIQAVLARIMSASERLAQIVTDYPSGAQGIYVRSRDEDLLGIDLRTIHSVSTNSFIGHDPFLDIYALRVLGAPTLPVHSVVDHMPSVDVSSMPPVAVAAMPPVAVIAMPPVSILSLPNVDIASMPDVTVDSLPSVSVNSLPAVTIANMPNVTVGSLPSVTISSMPAVTVQSLPSVTVASLPEVTVTATTPLDVNLQLIRGRPTTSESILVDQVLGHDFTVAVKQSIQIPVSVAGVANVAYLTTPTVKLDTDTTVAVSSVNVRYDTGTTYESMPLTLVAPLGSSPRSYPILPIGLTELSHIDDSGKRLAVAQLPASKEVDEPDWTVIPESPNK